MACRQLGSVDTPLVRNIANLDIAAYIPKTLEEPRRELQMRRTSSASGSSAVVSAPATDSDSTQLDLRSSQA